MRSVRDRCPHKHELAHKQLWTPKVVGGALNRGRLWHAVMEIHYKAIQSEALDMTRRQEVARYILDNEADDEQAALLGWMYDAYEKMWGLDPDWEVLGIEVQRLARLTQPDEPVQIWLRMRMDLLVRERFKLVAGRKVKSSEGKVWIVDHKTGKDLPKDRELDIDDQFGLYTWGAQWSGVPVFGSLHNAIRTYRHIEERPLEERLKRSRLYRTPDELLTIAAEAATTARTAYVWYAAPGSAPRAPDSDRCRWRCPYTEACLVGRKSGPEQERLFLEAGGFEQLTEEQALKARGYVEPVMTP